MVTKYRWFLLLLTFSYAQAGIISETQILKDDIKKTYILDKLPSLDCAYGVIECKSSDVYDLFLYKSLTFTNESGVKLKFHFDARHGDKLAIDITYEVAHFRSELNN